MREREREREREKERVIHIENAKKMKIEFLVVVRQLVAMSSRASLLLTLVANGPTRARFSLYIREKKKRKKQEKSEGTIDSIDREREQKSGHLFRICCRRIH